MFETLVSSKIRRALLEHVLTHPDGRFYLRGLAKELSLTVSPLRRELKRLEQQGILKAYEEANVRFYVVDQLSPLFAQLKYAASCSAGLSAPPAPSPEATQTEPLEMALPVASTVLSQPGIDRIRRALRPSMPWQMVVTTLGMCLILLVVSGLLYLGITNHKLLSLTTNAVVNPRSQVTVVDSTPRPTGEMQSPRWRLMPGAMGGFGAGTSDEGSY